MTKKRLFLILAYVGAATLGFFLSPGANTASAARKPTQKKAIAAATEFATEGCESMVLEILPLTPPAHQAFRLTRCITPVPVPLCVPVPKKPAYYCLMAFYLENLQPEAKRRWQGCSTYGYFEGRKAEWIGPNNGWNCIATNQAPPGHKDPPGGPVQA